MKYAIFLFFLFTSFKAISGEQEGKDVISFINQEEKYAEDFCNRTKNDIVWRKVSDTLNEQLKLFNSLSPEEKEAVDLSTNSLRDGSITNWTGLSDIYSYIIYEELRKKKENDLLNNNKSEITISLKNYAYTTRLIRALRICGAELFEDNLLPPVIKRHHKRIINLDEFKEIINDAYIKTKKTDDELFTYMNRVNKFNFYETLSRIDDIKRSNDVNYSIQKINEKVWVPFHNIYKEGTDLFSNRLNIEKFKNDNEIVITSALDSLKKHHEEEYLKKNKEEEKNNKIKERDLRIIKIRNGDIKVAKTCTEVAVGMIGKENLGGDYNLAISRDFQDVHVKPTNKIYSGIGKIINIGNGEINVLQSDAFRQQDFLFKIKHDSNTLWFANKAAYGKIITFVGKYIDNTTINIQKGNNNVEMPARVYDAVCIE